MRDGTSAGGERAPGAGEPDQPSPRFGTGRLALVLCVLSAALLVAGIWALGGMPVRAGLLRLQWAGSAPVANAIVRKGSYGLYRAALHRDMWPIIPCYAVGLGIACWLGWRVFWTRRMQAAAWAGMVAAATAGLCNYAQDGVLRAVLGHGPMQGVWPFRAAAALSFVKFSVLIVAAGIGLIALGTTAGRLAWHPRTKRDWEGARDAVSPDPDPADPQAAPPPQPGPEPEPLVIGPPRIEGGWPQVAMGLAPDTSWWDTDAAGPPEGTCARWRQNARLPGRLAEGRVGVCVSGGGIRSATVALGALQSLRAPDSAVDDGGGPELARADHLVSVSGGGYTAGAFQLALRARERSGGGAGACGVFAPGSPEEDHLRRHSSYIADTLGQWLTALGVLLRCVVTGIVLIGLAVATAGVAIGRFYHEIPIITGKASGLASLKPLFLVHLPVVKGKAQVPPSPHWPGIPAGVTLGLVVVLGLAVLAHLIQIVAIAGKVPGERTAKRVSQGSATAGKYLLGLTGLLTALGVAIPGLMWLGSWLSWHIGYSPRPVATAGSLSVIVGYAGALAGTLWKKRATITKTTGSVTSFFTKSPGGQVLPNSMAQMLLLWLCLAALILGALFAASLLAVSGLANSLWGFLPAGALLIAALVFDETWFGLHPFYRQRLASAFAVQRTGASAARPLDTQAPLSTWAAKADGFPRVRFAASANITGQDRTPPGRRTAPYVFTSEYVGGPQVGWIHTAFLEHLVSPAIRRDLEVQAAMAISGAAFAAAMGRQTRFFEVFLALTNARLGAWLPNPYFVALKDRHLDDWTVPGLPGRRRLGHLAREIFGIHPSSARMLLCTDGGHYDNLGLLELLRLKCALIYCFDASGGGVPLADTLAGTIALARDELGVAIDFGRQPYNLVPGGNSPPPFAAAPLATLNGRISKTSVIEGEITYPDGARGRLIFAQAALTKDLPFDVLEYSQDDTGFPRDGTADQWFDGDQFDAYQQLGRYLGGQALDAANAGVSIAWCGGQAGAVLPNPAEASAGRAWLWRGRPAAVGDQPPARDRRRGLRRRCLCCAQSRPHRGRPCHRRRPGGRGRWAALCRRAASAWAPWPSCCRCWRRPRRSATSP